MDFSIVLSLLLALLAFKGMNYHIHSCQYSFSVICEPTVNFNILKHKCHGFSFVSVKKTRTFMAFNCNHAYYRRASKTLFSRKRNSGLARQCCLQYLSILNTILAHFWYMHGIADYMKLPISV